jgi:hypothetical protein
MEVPNQTKIFAKDEKKYKLKKGKKMRRQSSAIMN